MTLRIRTRHLFRPLLLALAMAVASTASAQLKAPRTSGNAASGQSSPAVSPAPARAEPPPADAPKSDLAMAEESARRTSLGWLMLLDRGDWGTAYEVAAQGFRGQVPIAAWMDGIPKVRAALGALQDREPVEASYKTSLPGRPDGEYFTIIFASRFTAKPDTHEIITTTREPDGKWRVLGYSTR